jgi:hypothetical protein
MQGGPQGYPYFEGEGLVTKLNGECKRPTCSLPATHGCAKRCDECAFRFCAQHASHDHHRCCCVDQGVTCTKLATALSESNDPVCQHHYRTFVRATCRRCGRLQTPARREYVYCLDCRDRMQQEEHGYWYSLRQKGVSGPYGSAFSPAPRSDCVVS